MTIDQDNKGNKQVGCRRAALKLLVHYRGQKLALCLFSKMKENHGRVAGGRELH